MFSIYLTCLYALVGLVLGIGRIVFAEHYGEMPEGSVTIEEACWGAFYAVAWPIAIPLDLAWVALPWLARHMRDGAQRLFGGW